MDFKKILNKLNDVYIPECGVTREQAVYAVLELLNNSLRAHRERGETTPIYLHFSIGKEGLEVYLQDWGGGFDVSSLPYDLNKNPEEINIHNEEFESYRREHRYKKFGLGLYLAKKTFHNFSLYFIDGNGSVTDWENGDIAGTVILLRTHTPSGKYSDEAHNEEPARI
ncbi:MAG: ATP-binding protein [Spirochaetia bacterium]